MVSLWFCDSVVETRAVWVLNAVLSGFALWSIHRHVRLRA